MWKLVLLLPALLGALILAKALYNIFLHPLRAYPGPKLWAATRLPWCHHQYRGRLNHKLLELHNRFGTVVRVAPDELSYCSATAWRDIYGQRAVEMGKHPVFSLVTPTGVPNIMTADRATHSRHRRLMAHAFSEKALREQEDVLVRYSTKLLNQLETQRSAGLVDLAEWFHLTTFDLIGSLAFGQDFSCVDTGTPHPFVAAIKHVSRELIMSQMATYYSVDGLRNHLSSFFSSSSSFLFSPSSYSSSSSSVSRVANARRAKQMVDARIQRGPTSDSKDFWHYILAADEAEDVNKGLSRPEMVVNAFSIAIAGSDGTATALAAASYFLMTRRDVHDELRDALRGQFATEDEITSVALAGDKLPLLDAVLAESMRLLPPVAVTLPRVVPPGGAIIDGRFVPGGFAVGVNHFSAYRSPTNFHRADEFLPERWLGDAEFGNDARDAFQPFSVGPRSCLGKNLARAEMRILLARLLWRFDLELGEESEAWLAGQRVYGFWVKPKLMCKLGGRL